MTLSPTDKRKFIYTFKLITILLLAGVVSAFTYVLTKKDPFNNPKGLFPSQDKVSVCAPASSNSSNNK